MERIGTVRIPSAELETQPEGWVEISAYVKRNQRPYIRQLMTIDEEIFKSGDTDPEARAREMRKFDEFMASFVYDWNWKDQEGKPYPPPYKNPDAFGELRQEEFIWLQDKATDILAQDSDIPKQNDTPS